MLYALGPLDFEIAPFNTHQFGREHAADFAPKDLLGSRRGHEFVGDGEEIVKMAVKLFPHKLGGLDSLDMLNSLRGIGGPQFLMRGDGVPLGWYLITHVGETSTYLDRQGVGRMIDVEIELVKDEAPDAADYVASLFTLFG
jgi:phage protein U